MEPFSVVLHAYYYEHKKSFKVASEGFMPYIKGIENKIYYTINEIVSLLEYLSSGVLTFLLQVHKPYEEDYSIEDIVGSEELFKRYSL